MRKAPARPALADRDVDHGLAAERHVELGAVVQAVGPLALHHFRDGCEVEVQVAFDWAVEVAVKFARHGAEA